MVTALGYREQKFMLSYTKKTSASGGPLPGICPWNPLGDFRSPYTNYFTPQLEILNTPGYPPIAARRRRLLAW